MSSQQRIIHTIDEKHTTMLDQFHKDSVETIPALQKEKETLNEDIRKVDPTNVDKIIEYKDKIYGKLHNIIGTFYYTTNMLSEHGTKIITDKIDNTRNCIDILISFGSENINPIFFVVISGVSITFMYIKNII